MTMIESCQSRAFHPLRYTHFLNCLLVSSLLFTSSSKNSVSVMVGLVVFAIVPTCHWMTIADWSHESMFLYRLIAMLLLYALGFLFYYSHFPERALPGGFDIWVRIYQSCQWSPWSSLPLYLTLSGSNIVFIASIMAYLYMCSCICMGT
jgi:hypothetical protein